MKYFLIEADDRIPQPQFLDIHQILSPKMLTAKNSKSLPQVTTLKISHPKGLEFMDIISKPMFLISEPFMELVHTYDSNIQIKHMVLFDGINQRLSLYGLPILEELECLDQSTVFDKGRILKYEIILKSTFLNYSIFKITGLSKPHIVANLDLMESILRREVLGIKITELEFC